MQEGCKEGKFKHCNSTVYFSIFAERAYLGSQIVIRFRLNPPGCESQEGFFYNKSSQSQLNVEMT
jgi:hypothetical protein